MNRRCATLSTNFILVQNLFCRGAIGVQNLFCGRIDFRSKFILRFYFLNITVRDDIGKRYINPNPIVSPTPFLPLVPQIHPQSQYSEWLTRYFLNKSMA